MAALLPLMEEEQGGEEVQDWGTAEEAAAPPTIGGHQAPSTLIIDTRAKEGRGGVVRLRKVSHPDGNLRPALAQDTAQDKMSLDETEWSYARTRHKSQFEIS